MNQQLQLVLERLNERETLQSLLPKKIWDQSLEGRIEAMALPGKRTDVRIITLLAALHLRNDSLNTSHSYAQEIEHDATGAYWHGIMHRMEGDYSNAKYWFMRTGQHPVMSKVKQRVAQWLNAECNLTVIEHERTRSILDSFRTDTAWNPAQFVDLIAWQESSALSETTQRILEQLQDIEMTELFDYSLQSASMLFE
jgi:hypothetical protein